MRRDPFDQVCTCEFETETHICLCTRRLQWAGHSCSACKDGRHILRARDAQADPIDALRALSGEHRD